MSVSGIFPILCLTACGVVLCLEHLRSCSPAGCPSAGGGFHRYSVDEFWHIPHFEKVKIHDADHSTL